MRKGQPSFPKGPMRLLRRFCDPDLLEDVEGDLNELFEARLNKGQQHARVAAWTDVIWLFRPGIIRDINLFKNSNSITMLQNYFKAAWRNMLKHKGFAMINLMSLAIGIASCIAIYLFIEDERSFDAFHTKGDQLYRLCEVQSFTGTNTQNVALTMPGMGPTLKADFPEVLDYTRFWTFGEQLVEVGEKKIMTEQMVGVDSSFFQLFDFGVVHGDRNSIFDDYRNAAITISFAQKLFGREDPIGEYFEVDGDRWKVNGIITDVPENSHLQFEVAVSVYSIRDNRQEFDNEFGSNYMNTYLLLPKDVNIDELTDQFPDYLVLISGQDDITDYIQLFLQRLPDVHLASSDMEHDYNNYRKFNGEYLDVFVIIGILILVIASVNFTNLTTARAANRAKEVGIRKTIGAFQNQLIYQFMFESVMLALMSLFLGLLLIIIFLPVLNGLIDRQLSLLTIVDINTVSIIIGIVFLLGLLAGLYPSFYLSSFHPAAVLKGFHIYEKRSYLRSSLVVIQFSLALAMIVSTLVVSQQLMYIKNKDIGFNKEHILLIDMNQEAREKYDQLKTDLLNESNILGVAGSGQRLGNNFHQWGFKAQVDTGIVDISTSNVLVDYDYLDLYGIELVSGRGFSRDYATNNGLAFVINEALAKELGYDDPIGKKAGHGWYPNDSLGTIIGVTKDFNFNSLHYKVNTLAMVVHEDWRFQEISVKINGDNVAQTLVDIERIYNKHVNDFPIKYEFLDAHFEELYKSDDQMGAVVKIMAVLSIFIGCMGLFGLASIAIKRRVKEIGIRKVMGASIRQLVLLLSKDYSVMILVAFIVATPLTYAFLSGWLDNFAYRVDISPWVFVVGAALALVIAMVTISFHVIRAATSNPVRSLKHE